MIREYGRKRCNGCRQLKTVPWPRGYPAARCMADGRMRGAVIGRRPTDDCPVYRPAWCPGKEDAEFEAFLNNEVGKMYANDTQKLMLYRVDADERESYGYKDMGQIERLGALLSMLCKEIMDMVAEWKENDG